MTKNWNRIIIAGVAVAVLGGAGAAGIAASGAIDDENAKPITGQALDRASAAALASTGGGRVTETEAGDEESLYEVEVTLDDGKQVDVQLDADFQVVGGATDGGEAGDGSSE